MRRPPDARMKCVVAPLALNLLLAVAAVACDRTDEPPAAPASSAPITSASASPANSGSRRPAPTPVTADSAARMLPVASRDPDWGLDPADPARDYVMRYLKASKRYGAKASCVVTKASTFTENKSIVETRNDPSGACGKADDLRDRFFVSVATDRLSLDESLHQPKLQSWPDGSDPGAPPGKIIDLQDLRTWKAGLRDSFRKLELAPLRVQLYGRGTYPVISIAGWHGPVLRSMSPAELESPAKTHCEANDGAPLGIFAGMDRATLLRVTCPSSARFESL
jgi:hypothetical protein